MNGYPLFISKQPTVMFSSESYIFYYFETGFVA